MNVEILSAPEYDLDLVQPLVDRLLMPLAPKIIPNQVALLKVNLLMKAQPERAITTHPVVVEAVCRHLIQRGMQVVIADSPGGPMMRSLLEGIYQASGLTPVAERTGARLNYDLSTTVVHLENAHKLRRFEVLSVVRSANLIINLPKCKTHGMMTFTGATKNLFGVIPGLTKANHHFKLQSPQNFADHLVDLAEFIQADFHLMDGIWGMEGNGPSGGEPIHSGFLAASHSSHHLDLAISRLIGIDQTKIPTLLSARRRGLLSDEPVVTSDVGALVPFRLPESTPVTFLPFWVPESVHARLARLIRAKPDFVHARCIGCAKCAEICPAKVITMNEHKRPVCDHSGCISCFCCHEICPVEAIDIKRPLLGRLLTR